MQSLIDNIESLEQSIYKALMTNRYTYSIYSWNYGIVVDDLIGKPKEYIKIQIENRIKDTLKVDDRIEDIYNFDFKDIQGDRCAVAISFSVKSIFGYIKISTEV